MRNIFIFFLAIIFIESKANVRLPALVSDGMVLQRNTTLNIWGWADKNEKITVQFLNQKQQTRAGQDGKWMVKLNPVSEGGPYSLTVKGNNIITIKDILVGDV